MTTKRKTYKVRKLNDGLLLIDKTGEDFKAYLSGDECSAVLTRKRPKDCVNQKEVAALLGVSYGILRQGIFTGRYKLPPKQETVGSHDFYRLNKIEKWVKQERRKRHEKRV